MTRTRGRTLVIEPEKMAKCEICGIIAECRPYGPNEENVCFPCGMKDEVSAKNQFEKRLNEHLCFECKDAGIPPTPTMGDSQN